MKLPRIYIILFLCLLLSPFTILSQDSVQYRKLYLHTDRDHYFLGDTIWYKGYYLDGQSNKFIPGLITLNIDMINESGASVIDQVLAIDNGVAAGAMTIPTTLESGNYIIRAFTEFQKQFGEDAFFYKQVKVSKLESFVEGAAQPAKEKLSEIDVAFLPEGGVLLEGQMNTLGIKAIDTHGNGAQVQGEILDSKGESVATFATSYKGMGSFDFNPVKGESYTARTAAYPDFHYIFNDIVKEGIKIEFEQEMGNDLRFQVLTNAESMIGRSYYFAISHHGEVIFHNKFVLKTSTFPITVNKDALPAGINRMVLLDEQLLPVSERLYFSTNYQINEIKIKPDQQNYETRSRVRLKLTDERGEDTESWSNMSMVVIDEFAINREGPSMNILSWLLIDSELKGLIESPQDYFSNDPDITSETKLDLLMMTQGWSSYIWNKPEEYMTKAIQEEEGFTISGKVLKVVGNKPVTEGTVDLKAFNNDFMHMDIVEINEEGEFKFENVYFLDSASVFIQARNEKDKLSFKVRLDSIFNNFPELSVKYILKEGATEVKQAELYQRQYDNLQALKEYTLATGSFYIEEVSVYEHRRKKDDGHFRIYSKPSNSREITNRDLAYMSVIDYMQGRFAGVTVTKDMNIIIRGGSGMSSGPARTMGERSTASDRAMKPYERKEEYTSALLLLDGFPVSKDVFLSIPMSDIDVVEVLKNPSEVSIFGMRGMGGVVSIFTKKGGVPDYSSKYIPGTIAVKLAGYASNRVFYSPRYSKKNINSPKPDHRIVQYWDPNIFTENGKASVSFFTSDDISRYKVYVEGITSEGKICLGTAEFDVDQKNNQQPVK